jgi:preprotein translocase subunit SecF
MVGVTSGAYSSIFIAAPLLAMWKEREPEFARRKSQDSVEFGRATPVLEEAEAAAAAEPAPDGPIEAAEHAIGLGEPDGDAGTDDEAKREARRQRRKSRPHGRAR